jgi:ABC-type Fe3+/spermidine/putrescine transport system ATPase subunit
MSSIKIHNLNFAINTKEILHSVNLEIASGEFFFLLGPSGSGKTTLLRQLAGFTQPTTGEIYLNDKQINNLPARHRNIGMVFQSYALFPHLTVSENIRYGLEIRNIPKDVQAQKIRDVLERIGLSGYESRLPGSLSGGEQQRVALARALVIEPDLLLLDEPLSNLDAQLRVRMRRELRDIQKQAGITAVYVTHDQDEALSMADRMAVLVDGHILQTGSPHEIYYQPADTFIANFIGKANLLRTAIRDIKSVGDGTQAVLLETDLGPLWSITKRTDIKKDQLIFCCIRPESIQVADDEMPKQEFENRIEGTIMDTRFYGESQELTLLFKPAQPLVSIVANPRHKLYQKSEKYQFLIPPAEIILLDK